MRRVEARGGIKRWCAAEVFELARAAGLEMDVLDIGGGFPGRDTAALSFADIAAALRRAYEARTGDTALERLGPYLRDHVAFLDGSFRRHTDVSFDYVCSRGAI